MINVNGVSVGEVYPTNSYGDLVVERLYRSRDNVGRMYVYATVRFLGTGSRRDVQVSKVRKGLVKDTYLPTVHNVGYLGEATVSGNKVAYRVWQGMLGRCYNTSSINYKNYGGCGTTVDREWHNFGVFLEYYNKNYIEGYHLDKDLLSIGKDRVYSSKTCCFIPASVNSLIGTTARGDGVFAYGKQWGYGGSSRVCFKDKLSAYKYRSECFQLRLDNFLEECTGILADKVISAVTVLLQKEIGKLK